MDRSKLLSVILLTLWFAFAVDLIFTLFEYDDERKQKRHPYYEGHTYKSGKKWDGAVTDANFYHGFFRRGTNVLIFLCAFLAVKYRLHPGIFILCMGLEIADAIDYWLTRNDEWFTLTYIRIGPYTIYDYEIEFNHFRLVIIALFSTFVSYGKSNQYTG